ncbi:hypothetical protein [Cohnella sp. REN36]|uniref:hypothetical protein n=1 Tax=Cohnella sp. REN36 TaxID=2887347 RepID=UPI001D13F120|nr:hypothetical protein [Cohnella sp. REN36]MCC3374836.1 hypothetical protein [Cohnella sp. REN36]
MMKKLAAGGALLLCGIMLYIGVHIGAVLQMTRQPGFGNPAGTYMAALRETGGLAGFWIAVILGVLGIICMAWAFSGPLLRESAGAIRDADEHFEARRAAEQGSDERPGGRA